MKNLRVHMLGKFIEAVHEELNNLGLVVERRPRRRPFGRYNSSWCHSHAPALTEIHRNRQYIDPIS